jgi:hypothetical protein
MSKHRFWRSTAALVTIAAATLAATPAHAVDVDAGDYLTLPAGTTLGLVYFQHATRNKLYNNGNQVPINARLDSQVGILRGVWNIELGGLIMAPQFLLPAGRLKGKNDTAALGSESGVGDLILALPIWLTKPTDKQHFGIASYLFLPTGQYDRSQALNLGENRWKYTLQAGYITPVADKLLLDLIGDVTLFGKNDEVGVSSTLKQKPLFQLQGYLRYAIAPGADLRVGLSHTTGGETKVDGASQDDRTATTKMQFGGSMFFGAKTQLVATYGRDLKTREGFKENNRINLRLLQIF